MDPEYFDPRSNNDPRSTSNIVDKLSNVENLILGLDNDLDRLDDQIEQLIKSIGAALTPSYPTETTDDKAAMDRRDQSDIAHKIESLRSRVSTFCIRISGVIDRVDI